MREVNSNLRYIYILGWCRRPDLLWFSLTFFRGDVWKFEKFEKFEKF